MTGDSRFDVVALTAAGAIVRLSQNENGTDWEWAEVARVDPPTGLAPGIARLVVADLDNNGAADLVVAGENSARVLLGGAGRQLQAPRRGRGPGRDRGRRSRRRRPARARRASFGRPSRRSRGATAARPITGTPSGPGPRPRPATSASTRSGSAARSKCAPGLRYRSKSILSPIVHFGLGEATRADVVRIVWPNGVLQSEFDKPADATVLAEQRLKGSCPWLFAWNGKEMAFVTDLIWRSPLGLRINAQATADVLMTEDRVKLRGDQLAPRDGLLRPAHHGRALGDALLRPCLAPRLRPRSGGWRSSRTSASRCPRPQLDAVATGPVPRAARAPTTTGAGTSPTSCAPATTATSTPRAAAPTRASPATTSWRSSCRRTRRARGRSGSWPRAGSIPPTAR